MCLYFAFCVFVFSLASYALHVHYVNVLSDGAAVVYHISHLRHFLRILYHTFPGGAVYLLVTGEKLSASTPQQDVIKDHEVCS